MANCSCKTPHSSASQEKTMEGQRKTIHKLYIIIPLFCIILVYRFYVCRKLLSHNLGCGTPCGVWGVVCGRSPCCGGVGCGVRCWHHPYELHNAATALCNAMTILVSAATILVSAATIPISMVTVLVGSVLHPHQQ